MRIFGREPAFWIAIITATLTLVSTFAPWFDGVAGLVQGLLVAVWAAVTALHVQPVAPSVISGVAVALFDLLAWFGIHISDATVGAVNALAVVAVTGLIIRPQSTPRLFPAPDPEPAFVQGRVSLSKVGDDDDL